ncbi:hypothetical protein FCOL_02640 [Flavobacterium columnare ATCC 49512]|uniref:Uncharacterized protein n=1 Tax=Flavobacterium columnare (strain ATCC 49512 / CIP 103533 / TG 44/87) TaxID=1041826 RepID=G8X4E8_FLACA|nr:hypothetical protein FCOL_02640 [Flavobacterium columnare ATCC 49512]
MLPSLCKIAWEWFLALESSCFSSVGKVQGFFCLFYVRWGWENKTGKKCFAQLGKNKCLLRWQKPLERWQSVGRVGRKNDSDSVPLFLLVFF